jgi:hypothetical protein
MRADLDRGALGQSNRAGPLTNLLLDAFNQRQHLGSSLSVRYYPNADRTGYYIEVQRGWVGKPSLQIPDEFWRGTGYSSSLKPKIE